MLRPLLFLVLAYLMWMTYLLWPRKRKFNMKIAIPLIIVYLAGAWATFGHAYHNDCVPDTVDPKDDWKVPCSIAAGTLWPVYVPLKLAVWAFDPATKWPRLRMDPL